MNELNVSVDELGIIFMDIASIAKLLDLEPSILLDYFNTTSIEFTEESWMPVAWLMETVFKDTSAESEVIARAFYKPEVIRELVTLEATLNNESATIH